MTKRECPEGKCGGDRLIRCADPECSTCARDGFCSEAEPCPCQLPLYRLYAQQNEGKCVDLVSFVRLMHKGDELDAWMESPTLGKDVSMPYGGPADDTPVLPAWAFMSEKEQRDAGNCPRCHRPTCSQACIDAEEAEVWADTNPLPKKLA